MKHIDTRIITRRELGRRRRVFTEAVKGRERAGLLAALNLGRDLRTENIERIEAEAVVSR
jgi:hypothetical protein